MPYSENYQPSKTTLYLNDLQTTLFFELGNQLKYSRGTHVDANVLHGQLLQRIHIRLGHRPHAVLSKSLQNHDPLSMSSWHLRVLLGHQRFPVSRRKSSKNGDSLLAYASLHPLGLLLDDPYSLSHGFR